MGNDEEDDILKMLNDMRDGFIEKIEEDEDLKEDLEDFDRDVVIDLEDDGTYNFSLDNAEIGEIEEGDLDDPDIVLTTSKETFLGLVNGDINPTTAYARKKLKVDASFMDILKMKNLF